MTELGIQIGQDSVAVVVYAHGANCPTHEAVICSTGSPQSCGVYLPATSPAPNVLTYGP